MRGAGACPERFYLFLLVVFSLVARGLAVIGIYGLMAWWWSSLPPNKVKAAVGRATHLESYRE